MYIRTADGFADWDLGILKDALALLDAELSRIYAEMKRSADPDGDGLCDRAEYFIGIGFSVLQRYMACTYGQFKLSKADALKLPPATTSGTTFAEAINAGANYWKHLDEWGLRACVSRDPQLLTRAAQQTVATIEQVTPWDDYTLSNLLFALTMSSPGHLSGLVPMLVLWRSAVDSLNRENS